jgi:hypothetical protein
MARCTHASSRAPHHEHGRTLCFECFRAGMERTRARREAWAQRALPFEDSTAAKPLTDKAVAHRERMLQYLTESTRTGARGAKRARGARSATGARSASGA